MTISIICLDEELLHFVELYCQRFSRPKYQYFMTVLVGMMLCEWRRRLLGLLWQVPEASSVAGLSRILASALARRRDHHAAADGLSHDDGTSGASRASTLEKAAAQS